MSPLRFEIDSLQEDDELAVLEGLGLEDVIAQHPADFSGQRLNGSRRVRCVEGFEA